MIWKKAGPEVALPFLYGGMFLILYCVHPLIWTVNY